MITVELLRKLDACRYGIEDFTRCDGDLKKLRPEHYLWLGQHKETAIYLDDEHIKLCAKEHPRSALAYCSERLDDGHIRQFAKEYAYDALMYCSGRLDDKLFKWCAKEYPWSALVYCSDRLDDELFKWCAKKCPGVALRYCKDRYKKLMSQRGCE